MDIESPYRCLPSLPPGTEDWIDFKAHQIKNSLLPKDKPPLLSADSPVIKKITQNYFGTTVATSQIHHYLEAQREADIKHYEGK